MPVGGCDAGLAPQAPRRAAATATTAVTAPIRAVPDRRRLMGAACQPD
jgi:hypothetical protein